MKNQFELFCFYGIFSSFEINERVGLGNYKYIFGRRFPSSLRQIEKIVLFDETKIEWNEKRNKNWKFIQWARLIGSRFYPEKKKKNSDSIGTKATKQKRCIRKEEEEEKTLNEKSPISFFWVKKFLLLLKVFRSHEKYVPICYTCSFLDFTFLLIKYFSNFSGILSMLFLIRKYMYSHDLQITTIKTCKSNLWY